jgi:hypothetical protein
MILDPPQSQSVHDAEVAAPWLRRPFAFDDEHPEALADERAQLLGALLGTHVNAQPLDRLVDHLEGAA